MSNILNNDIFNLDRFLSNNGSSEGNNSLLMIGVNLLLLFSMFLYGINYILMKYFIKIKGSIYIFIILRTALTIPLMIYMFISKKPCSQNKRLLDEDMKEMDTELNSNEKDLELANPNEENKTSRKYGWSSKNKKKYKNKNTSNDNNNNNNNMNVNKNKCIQNNINESSSCNFFNKLFWNEEKLIPKVAYMPMLILSITGALRQVIVIVALQYTDSHNVAIIQPTIPIFTALISYYLKIEKMNYITAFSIFLSFFGLAITTEIWSLKTFDLGFFLLLTVPVTKGLQVIYINVATKYVSNDIIQFSQMFFLLIITLPFGIFGEIFINKNYNVLQETYQLTIQQFLCILYSTIAIIILCWKIQIIALNYLTPITVSLYQSFQPCFTFVLARLFLAETINACKIIGTIFIIFSLFLYQYGCTKHSKK
ncbi:drug/metabolite exporter, drug/metabolite transporter [Plasmodium sp. gorilla clade G3]|nr:drug/metabolite exporter, drug/metabolite transporter [Plasmodium sp. gorilla clade G3]